MMTKPNILLITIDSLRADHVGHHGYHRQTTPVLDDIAKEGVSFCDVVANGTYTKISFPNILASEYISHNGSYRRIADCGTTLPQQLQRVGYTTIGVHTNPHLSRLNAYHHGFDIFYDGLDLGPLTRLKVEIGDYLTADSPIRDVMGSVLERLPSIDTIKENQNDNGQDAERLIPYSRANHVTSKATEFTSDVDEPFFLWVHYMDPHLPYLPPREATYEFTDIQLAEEEIWGLDAKLRSSPQKLSNEELEIVRDLYDAEIRYTDSQIGKLLSNIQLQSDSNTILTVLGDHGDQFFERGGFGHGGAYSEPNIYDEILRVPLIFSGFCTSLDSKKPVSLIDVPPTILGQVGVVPPGNYKGIDITSSVPKERVRISEWVRFRENIMDISNGGLFAIRSNQWKYIYNEQTREDELYNLSADPNELQDLAGSRLSIQEKLQAQLEKHLDDIAQETVTATPSSVDERLEALGYK